MIPDENKELQPTFLNLVVIAILDQIIVLNHCGGSIAGINPLGARSTSHQIVTTKLSPNISKRPRGQNPPHTLSIIDRHHKDEKHQKNKYVDKYIIFFLLFPSL